MGYDAGLPASSVSEQEHDAKKSPTSSSADIERAARPAADAREYVTAKEVKDRLRIGLSTVYELFNKGDLEGIRPGRSVRIRADSVDRFVERNKNNAGRRRRESKPPLSRPAKVVPAGSGLRYL